VTLRLRRFLFCAALLAAGCRDAAPPEKTPEEIVAAQMETPVMAQYRGPELRWKMWGEQAEVLASGDVRVRNPKVLIYEKGEPALTVTAADGHIQQRTRDFRVTGSVHAVSREATLETDELRWNERDGTLIAPREARIHRGGSVLIGQSLVSTPNLRKATMTTVRGKVLPKDEKIAPNTLPSFDR